MVSPAAAPPSRGREPAGTDLTFAAPLRMPNGRQDDVSSCYVLDMHRRRKRRYSVFLSIT